MEHELFQSKLKPLVDTTSIPRTIRSSSSGETPHYTAVMGLIFGRSIQERRERVFTKAKNTLRSDPITQPKSSNIPDISTPPVQPLVRTPAPTPAPASASIPATVPAPQLPSPSPPNPSVDLPPRPASPSVECEVSLGSPTLSARQITRSSDGPAKIAGDDDGTQKALGGGRKKKNPRYKNRLIGSSVGGVLPPADKNVVPATDKNVDPPPSADVVQLACRTCETKQLRNNLRSYIYCNLCFGPTAVMKCVGCGMMRFQDTETCTDCYRRFE